MNNFKKEIWVAFFFVAFLGVLFQLNRMDALLHLDPWANFSRLSVEDLGSSLKYQKMNREQYLIVYDPVDVQSVLTRHITEKILKEQKKAADIVTIYENYTLDQNYSAVILATDKLTSVTEMPAIKQYVEDGGTAMIMRRLQSGSVDDDLLARMGVAGMGAETVDNGVQVVGSMYLGMQGYGFNSAVYNTSVTQVDLLPDAELELTTGSGIPIVWSHQSGQGKYLVCNSRERDDKVNYGLYTAMLSQTREDYIYPIINAKVYYIDDFPAPFPEGNFDKLYEETGLSTADFYRRLWWPEMLDNAEKYDVKYTGLIIESYGDQVEGTFAPLSNGEARNNLIVFGRELLKSGGELGIHGYNHQSLAPVGYGAEYLEYVPWKSQADMEASLRELKRYIEEVYPDYEIHTYVPPSNILSPQGEQAVKNVFPHLKVIASLFNGLPDAIEHFQNFGFEKDGIAEFPRISSGYCPTDDMTWDVYNVLNYNGVYSHFVHPDEIFYEESADLTWAKMQKGMKDTLEDIHNRFGWLQAATSSEAVDKMKNYFNMDYRLERDKDGIKLHAWSFNEPISFILRTHKTIESVEGGKAERIQGDAYILTVEQPDFEIKWAGETK